MAHPIKLTEGHPKLVLDFIVQRYGSDLTFEFSQYEDQPGILERNRQVFSLRANEITDDLIETIIQDLPERCELALNSRVIRANGNVAHIPMIDFSTAALAQTLKLSTVLSEEIFREIIWFNSGRSFHGYGLTLIDEKQWIELMGKLLLVNRPGYTAIVDPRWIGHRLIAGYSALRWSRNTAKYLHVPKKAAGTIR